jgi:hypothetical protein
MAKMPLDPQNSNRQTESHKADNRKRLAARELLAIRPRIFQIQPVNASFGSFGQIGCG